LTIQFHPVTDPQFLAAGMGGLLTIVFILGILLSTAIIAVRPVLNGQTRRQTPSKAPRARFPSLSRTSHVLADGPELTFSPASRDDTIRRDSPTRPDSAMLPDNPTLPNGPTLPVGSTPPATFTPSESSTIEATRARPSRSHYASFTWVSIALALTVVLTVLLLVSLRRHKV
jgi:hypothetical protein